MFKINWQKGDIAVRTTDGIDGKPYVEVVKYEMYEGRRSCFTLAYFHKNKDGVSLHFVGERPFEEIAKIDLSEVWYELWMTQAIMQHQVEEGEYDEN